MFIISFSTLGNDWHEVRKADLLEAVATAENSRNNFEHITIWGNEEGNEGFLDKFAEWFRGEQKCLI